MLNEKSVARRKKKQTFIVRLKEACESIPAFDKLGRDNPDYDYVFASHIFAAFRKELMTRDILIIPDEKEVLSENVPTTPGVTLNRVIYKVEYEIRDCRSEEKMLKNCFGMGIDGGDKALAKAKTSALKYFFRVIGMIPWIESWQDQESDGWVDDLTSAANQEQPNTRKKRRMRLHDSQRRAFDAAVHNGGKTAQQVSDYLRTKFDVATIADLAREDYNEAIKWACGPSGQELTEALNISRVSVESKKLNGKPQPVVEIIDKAPELAGD